MKKINVLQLVASICLLIGSIINLLNTFIDIPFAVSVCTVVLLLVAGALYIIYLVAYLKNRRKIKKQEKEGNK